MYRFSLAWTRLLPDGSQANGYNQDGVDYYNNLINALVSNNIEPVVSLLVLITQMLNKNVCSMFQTLLFLARSLSTTGIFRKSTKTTVAGSRTPSRTALWTLPTLPSKHLATG